MSENKNDNLELCLCRTCPFIYNCLRQTAIPNKNNQRYREFDFKKQWKHGDMPLDVCKFYIKDENIK